MYRKENDEGDFTMGGFYYIAFITCMFARKTLLDYTNLFSPNYYKKR